MNIKSERIIEELDRFEDTLIKALGWNTPEYSEERSHLGRKFDILKNRLGLF